MSIMGIRIREERKKRDLTQSELGKICGVTKYTISLYESGKSTPSDDIKQIFADYFDVSIDYLLGRTDVKKHGDSLNDKNVLQEEIMKLIEYNSKNSSNEDETSLAFSAFLIRALIASGEINGKDDIDKSTMELIKKAILKDAENTNNKKDANH